MPTREREQAVVAQHKRKQVVPADIQRLGDKTSIMEIPSEKTK